MVRLELSESTYECLITNLDDNFTPNDLKELYHLRWGIETSFRDLKHS
ncbi:transposase, partial [Ruoffia sp. FAM 24228]